LSSSGALKFRKLLKSNEFIFAPVIYDPLTAKIAEMLGYKALSLGGYAVGAHLGTTEPLTTMTEMVDVARRIASSVKVPLIVDAGAGYGEPVHVMRAVREFENAGVAGIHIEDQIYPKRMHYHRDYKEHIIDAQSMSDKIYYACRARDDKDFVIIARTDSLRTDGLEEAIRRANLYAEAGADMVMVFPNNIEETRVLPKKVRVPLIYVNSPGNRINRPLLSIKDLSDMGYKMLSDSTTVVLAAYASVKRALTDYKKTGKPPGSIEELIQLRTELENECLRLTEYYNIEGKTTENVESEYKRA